MSDTVVRYRKTPKTPFVIGNVLLASLGAALVFFGPEPWSVSTVLLVVLCLAVGGLLTLVPFLLDQFSLLNLNRSRAAQASINLRGALEKADELLDELRDRKTEDNPLRLVSERLPELVEEKLGEALEKNLEKVDERPSEILQCVEALSNLSGEVERLHDDVRVLSTHAATREFLEAGLSRLSEEVYRIETKLDELRRLKLYGVEETISPPQTPTGNLEPTPTEEVEQERKEPDPASKNERPDSSTTADVPEVEKESTSTNEIPKSEEPEPQGPEPQEPEPEEAEPVNTPPPEPKNEIKDPLPTETEPPAPPPEPRPAKKKKAVKTKVAKVIVSAFVGIQNGIYLRGDGPDFEEGAGKRLEMTGIGEWVWSAEISEPLKAQLFLNDSAPSDIGTFTVTPGDVLKLNPSFPTEAKS